MAEKEQEYQEERGKAQHQEEEWKRFQQSQGTTRYFIMKVKTEEQLRGFMGSNIFQPSFPFVREKLVKALNESDQVVIIISITGSDCFQAYTTIPKEQSGGDQDPLQTSPWSKFIVKLTFSETEHILNMMFNQNPVTRSKDGQPVDIKAALWVISLIDDKLEALMPSPPGATMRIENSGEDTFLQRQEVDLGPESEKGINVSADLKTGQKRPLEGIGDGERDVQPPAKLDKFGGSGIIPFDITRIRDYEEYITKHHQFMIEKYHDFMNRHPNYFVDQQRW